MKEKKQLILLIGMILIFNNAVKGQADNIGHLSNPLWYLGWNNLSLDPLIIQHQAPNQPIRFLNFDNNVGAGIVAPKM